MADQDPSDDPITREVYAILAASYILRGEQDWARACDSALRGAMFARQYYESYARGTILEMELATKPKKRP